jgi:hypothetical protein
MTDGETKEYVPHVVIQVPGSPGLVYIGQTAALTAALTLEERDDIVRSLRQMESVSFTLEDGSALALPEGIMAYTYFALVPADKLPFIPGGAS